MSPAGREVFARAVERELRLIRETGFCEFVNERGPQRVHVPVMSAKLCASGCGRVVLGHWERCLGCDPGVRW